MQKLLREISEELISDPERFAIDDRLSPSLGGSQEKWSADVLELDFIPPLAPTLHYSEPPRLVFAGIQHRAFV